MEGVTAFAVDLILDSPKFSKYQYMIKTKHQRRKIGTWFC